MLPQGLPVRAGCSSGQFSLLLAHSYRPLPHPAGATCSTGAAAASGLGLHHGHSHAASEDGKNKPRNANKGCKSFWLHLGDSCLISITKPP